MKWGREDPYLFLMILRRNEATMEFEEGGTECLGKFQTKEKMNSHIKFEEKLKKILKKLPPLCKTRDFRDWGKSPDSRQIHLPKHFKPKVLKNFLSIFKDWKSHSQVSCKMSRKNLYVPLVTGPSIHGQVAKTDPRARDCGMQLDLPAIESPKLGNNVFEIFSFWRTK